MKDKISILCPTYNEAGIAVNTLSYLYELCQKHILSYEIIIIDDASTDNNYEKISSFARDKKNIIVKKHQQNRGTAITMNELYTIATGKFVVIFSLDGEWDCYDVIRMVDVVNKNNSIDMLIGQRRIKQYTIGRKVISFLFNFLSWIVFGVKTYDAGGIKLVRQSLEDKISIVSKGVFNEAERIIRATKQGYLIKTIDIAHLPSQKKIKPIPDIHLIVEAIVDIFRVWFNLKFSKKS